jgi:hypothetical protein
MTDLLNHPLVDQRVEMPPHTHQWLSGDRYGRITAVDGQRVFILLDKSSRSIVKRMSFLNDCAILTEGEF